MLLLMAVLKLFRCWEPKVLQQMSSHYTKQEPLTPELIEKVIKRLVVPFFY